MFKKGRSVFIAILINLIINSSTENIFHYDETYYIEPLIDEHEALIRNREKRDTPTDLKNQYQVQHNGTFTTAKSVVTSISNSSTEKNNSSISSVVLPYNTNDRPLLGVNGTGQRKDVIDKQTKFPKKVLSTVENNEELPEEIIDSIDIPEDKAIETLKQHNMTVNQTTDHHQYYNSTIYVNSEEAHKIVEAVKNISYNPMLSTSHRRAMTVDLSFDFPFYGHPIRRITVATGGFLYTGEYVHSWLAATQYIAPLMANFDTSIDEESFVRFKDNGTAFSVIWENVSLQDRQDVGKFTFAATLHKNGDIVFVYYSVPILVNAIQDDKHPVKVGLSDAYIIDKVVYFARRKTIYEYHRVNFASSEISNSTIIYLKALSTCMDYTDCASCMGHDTVFKCLWCPSLNRCSTGTDRRTQEWLQKGCDRTQISYANLCPAIEEKISNGNQANTKRTDSFSTTMPSTSVTLDTHSSTTEEVSVPESTKSYRGTMQKDNVSGQQKLNADNHTEPKSMGVALGFLVPICLVMAIVMWVIYAYRNPHTKSGQLLIQYRPSQWSWRRGEARYTAATIHM